MVPALVLAGMVAKMGGSDETGVPAGGARDRRLKYGAYGC